MALDRTKHTVKVFAIPREMEQEIAQLHAARGYRAESHALREIMRAGLDALKSNQKEQERPRAA